MWVQIEKVVLEAKERTAKIPEDTLKCDYIMRLNGILIEGEAVKGNEVIIKTLTGRTITGTFKERLPEYGHDFGKPVEELLHIGPVHRKMLEEENNG
ncbi:MAG: 2-amino-4-ketopentanoate thiolase [Candidatus Muiribacterium halophilum]|uniref:2-amino-4-ketopentanoate thiolase n=1 Tax=Muiribacterium halophilum TaxID=2053465 RepID=A0A2N5ZF41_MUIH1|nr:MAG: 2-amino-4-ketopentanoate thiolase [Candidatus Muirbacterium halophilum]